MTKAKEHAIGERFEIDRIIYEVRPAHSCQGCSLYIEDENECLDRHGRFGHCDGNNRKDGQDVKFVQVGEGDEIPEDNERIIETIIGHLDRLKNYQTNTTNIEQCQDWLKSLLTRG